MYRRILVPLDGSSLAEKVLPYVRLLASSLALPVGLLRVFGGVSVQMTDPDHGRYLGAIEDSFRDDAMDYLGSVKNSLTDLHFPVSCAVYEGHHATWIVEEANKEPGTIVAMSTHGRSGITRWLLGSVTGKVLNATTAPLLVVRAQGTEAPLPAAKLTSIIAPLDGSSLAEQSLPHVTALAKGVDLKVMLVRVETDGETEGQSYLHEVREKLRHEGVSSVEERLLHGNPAESIVDLARETKDSVVVMTTQGRSGIGRWMVGSVTDRVVRHSGGPVLVIRSAT